MNHFTRRYVRVACLLAGVAALALAKGAAAQIRMPQIFAGLGGQPAAAAPGYLGIEVADVDAGKAQTLHLKDARGALITMIDHDAPAGQAGLRVSDVVVQLNAQTVESAEQLKQMLREMAAGSKVALGILRDGTAQTVNAELADRRQMEKSAWNKLGTNTSPAPVMGFVGGNAVPEGFHLPSFGSTLKVGAVVEPLTQQMAAHLGVSSGLMVKQVARSSSAEKAGIEALDVILKVGGDSIATTADWDRAVRANEGKQVQVTILRDGKQQIVTLEVSVKHHQGEVGPQGLGDRAMLSDLSEEMAEGARELRAQIEGLQAELSQKAADQLRQEMDEFRKNFNADEFQMQRRKLEEFRQQIEEWRAGFEGRFV